MIYSISMQRLLSAFASFYLALPSIASERCSAASAYAAFRRTHRDVGDDIPDSVSFVERFRIFEQRREQVKRHNAKANVPWTAAVNKFADYTDAELAALSGNRRELDWFRNAQSPADAGDSSFLQTEPMKMMPAAMDWRQRNLTSVDFVHDQGACGSCWATAAVSVVEVHAEIATGKARELSFEQVTECSPNPQHCGGQGGCKGATKGIALNWILENGGLALASDYLNGYKHGGDQKCKLPVKNAVRIGGVKHLPVNQYAPLLQAIATKGPVSVSVAANGMHLYDKGVYNQCERDSVSNHAVMMLGYGNDPASGLDYWLLRNSWGDSWGEKGYMRIQRHDPAKEKDLYCGTDYEPNKGIGCPGGPSQVEICGMCGVLYDLWYPEMVEELVSPELAKGVASQPEKTRSHRSLRSTQAGRHLPVISVL